MSLEENEKQEIRNEIDRLEQEVNEVAIVNKMKKQTGVNIIDVLQSNCKNIIAIDETIKLINNAIVSQQSRIMRMDEDIKKLRAINTLLSISVIFIGVFFGIHLFTH